MTIFFFGSGGPVLLNYKGRGIVYAATSAGYEPENSPYAKDEQVKRVCGGERM